MNVDKIETNNIILKPLLDALKFIMWLGGVNENRNLFQFGRTSIHTDSV